MCNKDIDKIKNELEEIFHVKLKKLYGKYKLKRDYEEVIFAELEMPSILPYVKLSSRIQRKPFTCVEIEVMFDEETRETVGIGFSKCVAKDEWDAKRGIAIALHKAVRHAARQLVGLDEKCLR